MNDVERDDPKWLRLLGASHADADPAVLARVMRGLSAPERVPRPLAWLGTPAALAAACALLVVVAGGSIALLRVESRTTRDATLMSELIGDDGSYGLPTAATGGTDAVAGDSDEVVR